LSDDRAIENCFALLIAPARTNIDSHGRIFFAINRKLRGGGYAFLVSFYRKNWFQGVSSCS